MTLIRPTAPQSMLELLNELKRHFGESAMNRAAGMIMDPAIAKLTEAEQMVMVAGFMTALGWERHGV